MFKKKTKTKNKNKKTKNIDINTDTKYYKENTNIDSRKQKIGRRTSNDLASEGKNVFDEHKMMELADIRRARKESSW